MDVKTSQEVDSDLQERRTGDPLRKAKVRTLVFCVALAVIAILFQALPIGLFLLVCALIFGAGFVLVRSEARRD